MTLLNICLLLDYMADVVTVYIKIKPYLKKYLISKSENKRVPVKFHRKHDFNIMLISLVTNYNYLKQIQIEDRENIKQYFSPSLHKNPDEICIILPFNDRKDVRSYNYLSVQNKWKFTSEVRLNFNFEFSRFMYRELKKGKQRKDIINEFKKLHNISEDDFKSDSLYRFSSRLLEKIEDN